jgi:hypothetical protein
MEKRDYSKQRQRERAPFRSREALARLMATAHIVGAAALADTPNFYSELSWQGRRGREVKHPAPDSRAWPATNYRGHFRMKVWRFAA